MSRRPASRRISEGHTRMKVCRPQAAPADPAPLPIAECSGGAKSERRVFDLNLAFDDTFDEARFWQLHVFSGAVADWSAEFRAELTEQMRGAAEQLPAIWAELPEDWRQSGRLNFAAVQQY